MKQGNSRSQSKQHTDWYGERFEPFLGSSADYLIESIGPDRIVGIYLCGSFALNEGSVVFETPRPIILSDVDLVVVLDSLETFREYYPRRPEMGSACERLLPDVQFAGRVEIGMFVPESMRRLPPSPGVYDMRCCGKVLYGGDAVLGFIPAYEPAVLSSTEAVKLIENRIIPLLAARRYLETGTEDDPYRLLYHLSRVYTDIGTAALCMAGRYRPGYRRRMAFLCDDEAAMPARRLLSAKLLSQIARWTQFKLSPSISSLGSGLDASSLETLWREGAEDLLRFWRSCILTAAGGEHGDGAAPHTETLLDRMQRGKGFSLGNLRSWRAYLFRYPPAHRIRLAVAVGRGLFTVQPLGAIQRSGVLLLDHLVRHGRAAAVSPPPGRFPHRGGDWNEAVRKTHAAWEEIVTGRK